MECRDIKTLISDYSVGLIEGAKKSEMERHFAECPECAGELETMRRVMHLIETAEPIEPPAGLWNGVYNAITQEPRREGIRERFHRRRKAWSVGFATAALATLMLFAHVHDPGVEHTYAASSYIQGHATYASQDILADRAALNSVAALAHRDQVGGKGL